MFLFKQGCQTEDDELHLVKTTNKKMKKNVLRNVTNLQNIVQVVLKIILDYCQIRYLEQLFWNAQ